MPVEFITSGGLPMSVENAVWSRIGERQQPICDTASRLEQLETENVRLRETLSGLIEALTGVLPNDVLMGFCGGSHGGSIRRDGRDGDVAPLEERLDGIDTVRKEVIALEDRFEDHRHRRPDWAHGV